MFDRLGQIRERALDEATAARKSVFDRLRGAALMSFFLTLSSRAPHVKAN